MVALGVGAVASVATPAGLRQGLTRPLTEEPAGHVELVAASSSLRPRGSGGRRNVRVEVSVGPGALDLRAQPMTLEVRRGGTVTVRRRTVSVASGEVALVLLSAPLPRGLGPWAATVTLPGRAERLLLRGATAQTERG